ncbi:MAG: phosphosulfolactate synthase [Gemmatimonadota bacterium]|nr:phosphosulfolactate synthase [Gemmatimonadota bacterium]
MASSSARLYRPDVLRGKIAAYHAAAVDVLLTVDFLEIAVVRGLADRVYAEASELGFAAVEVATAQTVLSVRDKCELVRRAAGHGLQVFAEVGRKGESDKRAHGGWLAAEAEQLLDAGAHKVLVQGEGIVEDVPEIDEEVLLTFGSRIPLERTVFQAKDTRAQAWFISRFGPHTSMDVDIGSAVSLELMRRGIRHRGLLGLVATAPPASVQAREVHENAEPSQRHTRGVPG